MNPEIPPADCGEYMARLDWRFCGLDVCLSDTEREAECTRLQIRVYRCGSLERQHGYGHHMAGG